MEKEIPSTINADDTSSEYRDIFSQQYRFNKRLLCVVGLWPYQSRKDKSVQIVGLLFLSFFIMAGQVRSMIRGLRQFPLFVECFTPLASNVAGVVKICSALFYTQEIQKDWEAMRHLPQVNILERHAETGKYWTIFYFTLVYSIVFGWYITAFLPKIMDAVAPLNYSRRRFDLFPTDFGVDPDHYFYPILIFLCVCVFYQFLVTVAIDTLYMVISQHVCAMFEILRYNLHNIVQHDESTNVIPQSNIHEDMHYHEIISCIKKHIIITGYIKSIECTCEWKLLYIIGHSTLAISFTSYMVVMMRDNSTSMDTMRFACFNIALVIHIFCNMLPSHWIMESSSLVPDSAYSCKWYMMSLRSKKLILFLIRASNEPSKIIAGKIYCMSMENFRRVLQTSMSYLTMLNSIQ